jgi:hypothetical protein
MCLAGGSARVCEARMGTLVFVCPATREEVSTGIEMDMPTLAQLDLAKIYCPQCRQAHHMAGIEYWLREAVLDDNHEDCVVKAA